LVVYPWT
nr:spinorphin=enkephalin-degrading enzyme inhibitor [cattle, spinal cord, Peptide, 7 aa] [Bos taurus]AAB28898.1 spinorphin=enkephalin-degrading enzyme inhibitor [cattle, spinal cord, Peptide, 7 aa] [Bos taurus]